MQKHSMHFSCSFEWEASKYKNVHELIEYVLTDNFALGQLFTRSFCACFLTIQEMNNFSEGVVRPVLAETGIIIITREK